MFGSTTLAVVRCEPHRPAGSDRPVRKNDFVRPASGRAGPTTASITGTYWSSAPARPTRHDVPIAILTGARW